MLPSEENSVDKALEAYSDKKSILTHFAESLTISGAIYQPSLRKLIKANGEAPMLIFVTDLLHEFLSFVPNGLNSDEIVLYAEKILAHCPTWSTSDLILCLKNGMDGKYGPVKFKWTWNSDFVEWAKKYDQQKDDFFFKRHVDTTKNAKLKNADLVKLFPKELIAQFVKDKSEEQKNNARIDIKVPRYVVDKGLKAVDEYIEKEVYKNELKK